MAVTEIENPGKGNGAGVWDINDAYEFLGGWSALLVETEPHGTVLRQGSAEFDQVEFEIKAWERSRTRTG